MNLYLRLCLLVAEFVYYQTARAQITITSVTPTSLCASSSISVSYSNTYSGQATLSLYLYTANSTASLYLTQLNTLGGDGTLNTSLPNSLTTGMYTVGIKLVASQTTYISPRSNEFTINAIPSSPTVTALVYCQFAYASPLSATASSGGTLLWYSSSVGGNGSTVSPTPSTSAVGTFTYYVSQRINGCEGPRAGISVIVKATPSPPATATPASYCESSQAAPLTASPGSGGTLRWYTSQPGDNGSSNPITPITSAAGTYTYYVSQVVNGCESPRIGITLFIKPKPVVSINPSSATLTAAQSSVTLTATSSAPTLLWSTGDTTTSILVNETGVYSVTATSSDGCRAAANSIIGQASTSEVYSIKAGNWDDSTIWSVGQLPTSFDVVQLRHSVSLRAGYQAQAFQVRYDEGGELQLGADGHLKIGN